MERRAFLKLSLVMSGAVVMPKFTYAKIVDLSKIKFSAPNGNVQSIIIFLYGGASQLAGNLTNIDDIEKASQNKYSTYFTGNSSMTETTNKCWEEAGGAELEDMISSGDMTIFRTCYSTYREKINLKAHGVCVSQNQRGSFDDDNAGVITNLAQVLEANGVINSETFMPFVTMEGESQFYMIGHTPLNSYLKPIGVDRELKNPYERKSREWLFYTEAEKKSAPKKYSKSDEEGGFDPALDATLTKLAQENNSDSRIRDAFDKRELLAKKMEEIANIKTPDLGANAYPNNSKFAQSLQSAIKILKYNSDTKVITIAGSSGLGGWDDHSSAKEYIERSQELFHTLKSAVAHIKAEDKIDDISIFVFGEFGRGVNLNSAHGWDHGNLQNLYVIGGKGYLNHKGIVGETYLSGEGNVHRLYLKPKEGSYSFEPLNIASTIYQIHGIQNPQELTGYPAITPLFN